MRYLALKTLVSKLLFCLHIIAYRLFTSAKTDAEICHTYPRVQIDGGSLAFHFLWSTGEMSGGLLTCA